MRLEYLGHGAWTSRGMSFPPRVNSEIIFVMTSAMKLMSRPNSSVTSELFDLVTEEKRRTGYLDSSVHKFPT